MDTDADTLADDFIAEAFAELRHTLAPWLPTSYVGPQHGPEEFVTALRAAEASHAGAAADLWGRAAANASAAAWIDADGDTGRQLWAVTLDYVRRAAAHAQEARS